MYSYEVLDTNFTVGFLLVSKDITATCYIFELLLWLKSKIILKDYNNLALNIHIIYLKLNKNTCRK